MLRVIDTQTILQQTQELSNRQQATNNKDQMLQHQFSNILNKEVQEKNESVSKVPEDEKVKNNTQKDKQQKKKQQSKQLAKQNNKGIREHKSNISDSPEQNITKIDIRI